MASIVFILGAGASKRAGVPLMVDFLDTAKQLWRSGGTGDAEAHFAAVFKGIAQLQRVHSKSQMDLINVESVFAAFEMATIIDSFADYKPAEVKELAASMRVVIARTIEETLMFPVSHGRRGVPPPYHAFAEMVVRIRQSANPRQSIAIITFNYDLATDFAFTGRYEIDYALESSQHPNAIPLLKLHGSLNWVRCKTCGKVVPWTVENYISRRHLISSANLSEAPLRIGSTLREFSHAAGHESEAEPVLVPPTWNKSEYQRSLSSVWARAARELKEAENIFVIGYSLPETDAFFRYLYSLGTLGDTLIERLWVINPDKSGATEARFRTLLGSAAEQRFQYLPTLFETAIGRIEEQFPVRR